MKYSVLIVGLGRIGIGYDLNHDKDQYILTHVRAFNSHARFQVAGGVDPDPANCNLLETRYRCRAFGDIATAINKTAPEVVVVATPTELHCTVIEEILRLCKPLAILCEKPISYNVGDARKIVKACKAINCDLFVNYMRRSDVAIGEIINRLKNGKIVSPIKGVVWYTKGLFNSASHFVNLSQELFGKVEEMQIIDKGRQLDGVDPEPDFKIKFTGGEIYFCAAETQAYFHNTMELLAANGCLRYERGGEQVIWRGTSKSKVFSGYTTLDIEAEALKSDFFRVQWHVVDQLALSLTGNPARICSADDALVTLDILAEVRRML